MDEIKSIIESLLFVSETPLSVERIKRVIMANYEQYRQLHLC